jgi:ribosomal protein RSM22 (predicted rRNA methylase)
MNLPHELQKAIETETGRYPLKEIAAAYKRLSDRYRSKSSLAVPFMNSATDRSAYLAARMPATYAVCWHVLQELHKRAPQESIRSLLDLGAGPGTASWAAVEVFSTIERCSLMEQDGELIAIGKRLMSDSGHPALQQSAWKMCHLEGSSPWTQHDITICSYALGEIPQKDSMSVIDSCWDACNKFCIFIEPGTPEGFATILRARDQLINRRAYMIAPCPHMNDCPMNAPRWCHFAARVGRSFLHAYTKEASVGFEDEKYSYVIFSKTPIDLPYGRIISTPLKRSGHVSLHLCAKGGEESRVVSKRTKDAYKQARKLEWGESLE